MRCNSALSMAVLAGLTAGGAAYGAELPEEAKKLAWGDSQPVFAIQTLYDEKDNPTHSQGVRSPRIIVAMDGGVLAFGAGKMRRSQDGGETWDAARDSVGSHQVVDENRGDILSVSLRKNALWRSRDHGVTWEKEEIIVKPNATMSKIGDAAKLPGSVHTGGCESGITIRRGDGGLHDRLLMPARYQPFGSNDR